MRRPLVLTALFALLITAAAPARAHFGMLLPSTGPFMEDEFVPCTTLTAAFAHPAERQGMDMPRPTRLLVRRDGETADLTAGLTTLRILGHAGWQVKYTFDRPGAHVFGVAPQPYWEADEGVYIAHYVKTVVSAFDGEAGWADLLGLPVEIQPLTRPFGLFAGQVFQGRVLARGKPAAGVVVEVSYYQESGTPPAYPTAAHQTQVTTTDDQGVFTFSCPWPGWWGFAGLVTGQRRMPGPDGKVADVEEGAVIWVYFHAP